MILKLRYGLLKLNGQNKGAKGMKICMWISNRYKKGNDTKTVVCDTGVNRMDLIFMTVFIGLLFKTVKLPILSNIVNEYNNSSLL